MRLTLPYGRTELPIDLPDDRVVKVLAYRQVAPLPDPEARLDQVLAEPLGTAPLVQAAAGAGSACVLICDVTRPVPNALMLPPILRDLERAGIPRDRILILVATGLHRPNVGDELRAMVGDEVYGRYRIENHDGLDLPAHVDLGTSPEGVPIHIDRRYVQADFKVATGLIEPHFMAGFSGGRKLICPGIASIETIRVWHGPRFLEHPLATTGVLEGNPVHRENTWIARHVGCDFIVNVALDDRRRPLEFVAGDMIQAFEAGVAFVRRFVVDRVPRPADIVVTSGAGYPLDTTFYQCVKGIVGAAAIVRDGGTIVLAGSMSEGLGSPEFAGIFDDHPTLDGFMQAILADRYFRMDQWQLEELAKACRRARVKVVTDGLSHDTLRRCHVEPFETVEQAVDSVLRDEPLASIAVVPKGPYVIGEVGEVGEVGESRTGP